MNYLLPAGLRDGLLAYLKRQPWEDVNQAVQMVAALPPAPELAATAQAVEPGAPEMAPAA
jgi:hypothetical protein